jgi:hypothetical protein
MTGKKTVREMLLESGFKIAEPDDPIYERLSTIFVSPISAWLEKSPKRKGKKQNSALPLNPTTLPLDPAAGEASMQITQSKPKGKNEQPAKRKKRP